MDVGAFVPGELEGLRPTHVHPVYRNPTGIADLGGGVGAQPGASKE